MQRKRKSNPDIDEAEDGAAASSSKKVSPRSPSPTGARHNHLAGVDRLDQTLLDAIAS
jgi:hypothetical protein